MYYLLVIIFFMTKMSYCLGNEVTDYESEFEKPLKIKREQEEHQVTSYPQGMYFMYVTSYKLCSFFKN